MNCGVFYVVEKMERETRIELATNSLEGCDSTIELLPLLLSIIPFNQFRFSLAPFERRNIRRRRIAYNPYSWIYARSFPIPHFPLCSRRVLLPRTPAARSLRKARPAAPKFPGSRSRNTRCPTDFRSSCMSTANCRWCT